MPKKSTKGKMLKVLPYDKWKIELTYGDQLTKDEQKWLFDYYNESIGWFLKDRKLLHANEQFLTNSLKQLRKNKDDFNEFLRDKRKWEKKRNVSVTQSEFLLQKIKQQAWNDKNSRRDDCFALNYKNSAEDESKAIKSKNEVVLENLSYDKDLTEFQQEFLAAYKNNTVMDFLIEWMDFALDIEEMEVGSPHIFQVGNWWEKLKQDYQENEIRATFFRVLFFKIVLFCKDKCETKNEVYFIYDNLTKVFKNFYDNKEQNIKGNVYV